jgi:hypothetical protein
VTNWTKGWLAKARISDDPEGDLIADMRGDPSIPPLFGSADEMRGYIRSKGMVSRSFARRQEGMAAIPAMG